MRKLIVAAAIAAGVVAGLGGAATANHIGIAGVVGTPEGPGTSRVNFVHFEKETSFCCAGSPYYRMGDGGYVSLNAVVINQNTRPGTYSGYGNHPSRGSFRVPYTVEHLGEPPLAHGTTLNTKITFSYTYAAPGLYTVTWSDCCYGTPSAANSIPREVQTALGPAWPMIRNALNQQLQPVADDVWEDGVQPVVESLQAHQPLGISGGTARVEAL